MKDILAKLEHMLPEGLDFLEHMALKVLLI